MLEGYKELRQFAQKQGGWDTLRPVLREILKKSRPDELIRADLDEGEVDQALEAVKAERRPRPLSGYGSGFVASYGTGMLMEVAKAAEATRPRAALEIY